MNENILNALFSFFFFTKYAGKLKANVIDSLPARLQAYDKFLPINAPA